MSPYKIMHFTDFEKSLMQLQLEHRRLILIISLIGHSFTSNFGSALGTFPRKRHSIKYVTKDQK